MSTAREKILLTTAVKGSDAILSTLGPRGKPNVMAAESTRNILNAMETHDVKRLVLVSVSGVAIPQDKRGKSMIDSLLRLLLRDTIVDRENQLVTLHASKVDWVAVRIPRLTNEAGLAPSRRFSENPLQR